MARITATFEDDGDMQRAVDALLEMGIGQDAWRIITPPSPDPDTGEHEEREPLSGELGLRAAGLAGLGAAAVSPGVGAGMGYPLGGAMAGIAAGAVLGAAFAEIGSLDLDEHVAELYRRRLHDGASILSVETDHAKAEKVGAVLHGHNGSDVHGA